MTFKTFLLEFAALIDELFAAYNQEVDRELAKEDLTPEQRAAYLEELTLTREQYAQELYVGM